MLTFGVVLGAGGGTGRAFHAGVLAALHELIGLDARDARVIVGTSAGALDGALLRAGVSPGDLFAYLAKRRCTPAAEALFASVPEWSEPEEEGPSAGWRPAAPAVLTTLARRPWRLQPRSMGTLVAAMMPLGRRPTEVIERSVAVLHPEGWPSQPLWICAVHVDDGRRVVFGRDPDAPPATVGRAVAASCAMPSYFAPVAIGGQRHVDGGMYSPSNADLLAGLGLDLVIISSPQTMARGGLRSSTDTWFRAACRMLLRREAAQIRRAGSRVLLVEPTVADLRVMGSVAESMNTSRLAEVATQAYASTVRRLTTGPLARAVETALLRAQPTLKRSAS